LVEDWVSSSKQYHGGGLSLAGRVILVLLAYYRLADGTSQYSTSSFLRDLIETEGEETWRARES